MKKFILSPVISNMVKRKNEINVVCSLYGKSFGVKKIIFIFFLFSICKEVYATEECDFVKCVMRIKSFIFELRVNKIPFDCKEILDIPSCSKKCVHRYFPNIFLHQSKQVSFTEFCNETLSNRLNSNWSCIARHKFRLLTCLANVTTITTNHVREELILAESCRKNLEFQKCPEQVLLAECGEGAVNVMKDLIQFILDFYLSSSCKITDMNEVSSMPVYYQLGSDFMEAAKSFDSRHVEVDSCFNQLIQDEIDLYGFLCGDYDPLTECVSYILTKYEKSFHAVRRLILKMISVGGYSCNQSSLELKSATPLYTSESKKIKPTAGFNEALKDESASTSKILTPENVNDDMFYYKDLEPVYTTTLKGEAKVKNIQEISVEDSSGKKVGDNEITKQIRENSVENKMTKKNQNHANSVKTSNAVTVHGNRLFFLIILLFVFT